MLIKKSFYFLLARGIPGLISLFALIVYTRLMPPDIYGQYTIVMSLVVLVITMGYQWLQLVVLRFYPKAAVSKPFLISNVTLLYALASLICLPLFALALHYFVHFTTVQFIVLALALVWVHAFFDMALQIIIVRGDATGYARYLIFKAALGLLLGVGFYQLGLGAMAPFAGLLVTYLLADLMMLRQFWHGIQLSFLDRAFIQKITAYGLPLTGSYLMNYIMSNSDRLMLLWLEDEHSAGLYAAAYDLSSFAMLVVLSAVHYALYPLALKAFEQGNQTQGSNLLAQNLLLLLMASVPLFLVFIGLTRGFSQLILGQAFWDTAYQIIPIITLATWFYCLKLYYFDLSFLIRQKTRILLLLALVGGVTNIILNYFFIKVMSISGAAWATLLSYCFVMLLSFLLGRRYLRLPVMDQRFLPLLWIVLLLLPAVIGIQWLMPDAFILPFVLLIALYLFLLYFFNIQQARDFLHELARKYTG